MERNGMNTRNAGGLGRGRMIGAAGLAVGIALLSGCSGHGKYTTEHRNSAAEKLSLLKSGTEWQMAHQQFLAGDLEKALKSVDNSIALNNTVTKSHVLRGRILIELGNLEAARLSLLEAEKLDPTAAESQYYLGIIHERFNESSEALTRYTAAMDLEPSNPQYTVAAAEMLVQMNRLEDAETMLNERRGAFQYNAAVRQTLGHIKMMQGLPEDASKLFEEARVLAPDDLNIVEDLARAQIASRRYAEAEFNLGRVIDSNKDRQRRDLMHLRVQCLRKLDRPVEARSILQTLTNSAEGANDLRAWIEMGNVSATLNDSARLRAAASRVISLSPNTYEGYFLRALHLRRVGEFENALASAERASTLSKRDAGPLVLKALIEQDLGRKDAAQRSLSAALKLDPSNAQASRLLGAMSGETTVVGHPAAGE